MGTLMVCLFMLSAAVLKQSSSQLFPFSHNHHQHPSITFRSNFNLSISHSHPSHNFWLSSFNPPTTFIVTPAMPFIAALLMAGAALANVVPRDNTTLISVDFGNLSTDTGMSPEDNGYQYDISTNVIEFEPIVCT
jgi:hypothetical protein